MKDINIDRQNKFNKEFIKKKKVLKFPLFSSIEINLHGSCNRRCAFCPRVDEHLYPNLEEEFDPTFFEKICKELEENNYEGRIGFSGFSEPFLHTRLEQLVSIKNQYIPKARLEIVTNGDYVEYEKLRNLFDNGLYSIRVSIYTNDKYVENFVKIKNRLDIEDDRFIIRKRNLGRKNDFGLTINNRAGSVDYSRIGLKEKLLKLPLKTQCNYPMFKMFIDYDGSCLLCSNDWKKKKIIGNAKKENLYDIWNSHQLNVVRKKLLNKDRNLTPCSECDVNGTYNGGEFADAWKRYLVNI
tara:strand:+ start:107 stop:997 length:891 start_codon:yes stop_codon:yes gene_type:complete